MDDRRTERAVGVPHEAPPHAAGRDVVAGDVAGGVDAESGRRVAGSGIVECRDDADLHGVGAGVWEAAENKRRPAVHSW
jgi:hypothetical protein